MLCVRVMCMCTCAVSCYVYMSFSMSCSSACTRRRRIARREGIETWVVMRMISQHVPCHVMTTCAMTACGITCNMFVASCEHPRPLWRHPKRLTYHISHITYHISHITYHIYTSVGRRQTVPQHHHEHSVTCWTLSFRAL